MLPFEEESTVKEPELHLPEGKMSFKPEELYRYTKIKPFVLRFWESEFPTLKPKKTELEGLAYSRADLEMILAIKHLLYDKGLTLAGARRRLAGEEESSPAGKPAGKKKSKKPTPKSRAAVSSTPAVPEPQGKSPAKRGLPATGAPRSRVSLEELLPGKAAAAAKPAERKRGKTKNAVPAAVQPPLGSQGKDPELQRKLSEVLRELHEILTLLNKGDR
jgi:DNA-binding transcriptional MerR regulator